MDQQNAVDSDHGRFGEAEQPDGRLIVYRDTPVAATESGQWLIGDPVTVRR
ncbi:MAG: hypothetical protein J07HB67_00279 [halophilic archaeon J07HB67]|jgi:hypothetical protein|nr:MAG: hypothetical protein J07HB67_00279 [halophilic archaeon J07HB67]